MYQPDGLLTLGSEHDVGLNPYIIAPDPYASDECLDVSPSPGPISLTATTMGDDDPPSGRLRPRKSVVRNLQIQPASKLESKVSPDKLRITSTPSKASPNKHDDLVNKSEFSPTPQFLCPYCEKKFVSKQTVAIHARRMHLAASKQGSLIACLFCNQAESNAATIIHHMVDCHPNQYFACLDCNSRFSSTSELAEHKLHVCEKQKVLYRSKLREKDGQGIKKRKKSLKVKNTHNKNEGPPVEPSFNGIVISCELKPSLEHIAEDIEDNITTNVILPPSKSLGNSSSLEKSAVIILDDVQWNKRIPPNFNFHNTDADQILSRLGVVHKSPRTGESTKKEWFKSIDESSLKFEKCFDTTFYSKVSSNVQENLSKFLDGSFNFNPDPESVIKTRKSKKSVVINTAEGFPILLACEQYSRNIYDGYLPRSVAPRHKWIRDIIENERNLINPDQIKRDSHVNNCIITLVSGLDIWTQLCMRRKFEDKNRSQVPEKKVEKRTNVRKELEDILESRELPSTSQVERPKDKLTKSSYGLDFPASLGLVPSTPRYEVQPAVLSGEWVRPRCYVCCACGAQTRDPRTLTSHITTRHPNAQVQHYEIVGEVLLNADILKHLYIPPSQISNRTRHLRGFRECTKCMKSISLEDLHQHMLDCAGDMPAVRRRQGRHRPFGVRRRRPRLADNTVRKNIRKDIRTRQRRQKTMIRPRQKIRTEVGDAETIRKMLAGLPAKRHRVLVNPLNHMTRPRVKREYQKKKIMTKKRSADDKNIKDASGCKDSIGIINLESNTTRNVASNSNDEDKSLRSKISRGVVKSPRQSQRVKRNANISRIKRKSVRLKEQQLGNKDAGISQDFHTELSNDDSLNKIDIKRTGYKTREHANQTGSNNRGEQRQGCSRSDSNSNNSVAPTQSVPLKHSIARLTANSETHDKSVQFHHLFLVQQECNNVNQHMPSGERTLFENEDGTVRLDKPPLSFCQKSSLDHQKKMNKPRKGLNDCIAMLRHKLLDPVPSEATEHVSVQCGGDEPLDFDVSTTKQTTSEADSDTLRINPAQSNRNLTKLLRNSEHSDTSTTTNESSEENEYSISPETVTVAKKGKDVDSVKHSHKVVLENEIIIERLNERVEIIPEDCLELNLDSENSKYSKDYTPSTADEKSSQNTLNEDYLDSSSQISTRYSELETICKNNTSDCEHLNKLVSTSVNYESIIPSHKDMHIRTETDLTQKVQVALFSQPKEFENIPAEIPPAHASTNVAPMLTIPLDLSSKLISSNNQITNVPKYYSMESYDYYETLDLSNKTSFDSNYCSQNSVNDDVVDLRVKPMLPEYQYSIDLCVKSRVDETQNFKDLSDYTPTDLSVKGKGTDTRSDNCQYDRMPLIQNLSSHSIMIQESRFDPFVASIDASQSCPTDLSSKTPVLSASNIEQSSIYPKDVENSKSISKKNDSLPISTIKVLSQTNLLSSKSTVSQNDDKDSDCLPQLNQNIEAVLSQKSNIYDSALVIPQYKMKATSTKRAKTPENIFLIDSFDENPCSSNNVPNIITSSSSLDSFTKPSVHMSGESQYSSGDNTLCTIISKSVTVTAGSSSKTEGTELNCAPLYTSSCSSVPISTEKIASNVGLSICQSPIATTVSSTTIYTTSSEASSNHNCLENKVITVSQKYGMDVEAKDIKNYQEKKIEKQKDSCAAVSSDQDPETARKIAMLPKELVEIIGNMPADHRNQLLNVLPQYVSTPSASCVPHTEPEKVISLDTSQIESFENKEVCTPISSGLTSQVNLISKQSLPSPRFSDDIHQLESSALQQLSISPTNDKIKKTLFNTECVPSSKDDVKKDRDNHLEYMALVSNKVNALAEYDKNGEKAINLTEEENSILSTEAVKVVNDLSNAVKLSTSDIPALKSVEKPDRTKVHSEKTASLRAVRIKAPAERQKENQLLKRMSVEQQCKSNISDSEENEVNKSSEPITSLAIQQAEISSTQSNKNVQPNMNNEPESNGDETHPPLLLPIERIIENQDNNSHKALSKSAIVTSSIAMNNSIRENSKEINVNKPFCNQDIPKESNDDTAKTCVKENMSANTMNSSIKAVKYKQKITNKSPKLIMETKKRKVHTHTKTKTKISESHTAINDDDSEDDVSLASIVKQKKNLVKMIEHKTGVLPDVTNALLAKNDQQLDNDALKSDVYEVKANANNKIIKRNKRSRHLKNSVCNSRVLAETANVVNQRCKNKTKKRSNVIEPASMTQSDSIKNIKEKIENSDTNVVSTNEQGNENVMLVDEDARKSKLDMAIDKTGSVEGVTEMELLKHSSNDNISLKLSEDILSTVQKENINKLVTQTKKYCKSASKEKFDDLTIEQEKVRNDSLSASLSTVVLEQNAECLSNPKENENIEENPSQLENSKEKKGKLSTEIESTQEVLNEHFKEVDNVLTPLRRSRRGKSLYTENSTDSVILNDTGIDQKTPLTKKQLIFSKLLLDEETLAKQTDNHQNKDIFDINSAEINETVKNNEEKTALSEFTSVTLKDKIKGTKRKKTHQIKGKCKKKKALDSSPCPNKNRDLISETVIDTVTEPNMKNHDSTPSKHSIQENEKEIFDLKLEVNKSKVSENNSTRNGKQTENIIEKRKLASGDGGHISKTKKTKEQSASENKKNDLSIGIETTLKNKISAETNVPVAAKRTRSKSVIVKSVTSDLYDPYNIDFDDISQKAEPFRKALKQMKAVNVIKEANQNTESYLICTKKEISTGDNSKMTYSAETEKPKRNPGKCKTEPSSISAKYDMIIENSCQCDPQNIESKQKTAVNRRENINENLSDSDDSSKSDIPLKKYLEGKEKRMMAEKEDSTSDKTKPKKSDDDEKITAVQTVSQTEEQLRSEQFMESFGFFSERKPRKSNLLASKKISETFHIIANENDDIFYGSKQRMTKKVSPNENKKIDAPPGSVQKSVNKTATKKGKKNKNEIETGPCYCYVCEKTFYRPDNYLRHQMTLLHVSKLSEIEMKVQTNPIIEEPNYLVAFRDQINRLKELALKLAVEKKKKNKIKMPSLDIILDKVNKIIKKQKMQQRGLSTDQALFLDCCELLKESHKSEVTKQESIIVVNDMHDNLCSAQSFMLGMDIIEKTNNDGNADSKSECDSITAKSILESEEVRNLENDLISGLKEAAKINQRIAKNMQCQHSDLPEISNESFSSPNTQEPLIQVDKFDLDEPELNKCKKNIQTKTKMYPDVEDIDIFEDKFDKIKRKCRSQAAAAKQTQSVISVGHKIRKKIDRKKGKRALKKNYQSTVMTKGALKGFDGIKVSIPTSEINVPGINVSLSEVSPKKKKRKFSKEKREKKDSESSTKYESDSRMKEGSSLQRKHDVYEFMDNEDAELFEFRPSTLMERFKSMHSKEYHPKDAVKLNASVGNTANTSESGSDEDDFVYMSDNYVCSDDETENSLLSCEISNLKAETKKIFTPPRRKDVVEKNAVMGKIFKHNAVRSEKKELKAKEADKPKTNLDQLFDSLLEDEPVKSKNNKETSPRVNESEDLVSKNFGSLLSHNVLQENVTSSLKMHDSSYLTEWDGPSTSKQGEYDLLAEPSTSKSFTIASKKTVISSTPTTFKNDIETNAKFRDQSRHNSPNKESQEDFCNEAFDETGVARQRARRKCTVGKQNVLAETWSSESEPDGVPIRLNSAESLVTTSSRKKRGKKREGYQSGGRRGYRPLSNKKDAQSRVNSSRKISTSSATGNFAAENQVDVAVARGTENKGHDQDDMHSSECATSPAATTPQGPFFAKGQPRSATSYWSPGGATEQEHIQQHGWIVGDSHKKLVTMLAHAKGRKRHNDDKRHLVE